MPGRVPKLAACGLPQPDPEGFHRARELIEYWNTGPGAGADPIP